MLSIDLSDRTALVTGASGAVGRGIALALAAAGCDIIIHYFRGRRRAEQTAEEVRGLGREALAVRGHLGGDDEQIERMFSTIESAYDRLDIVVNNAASGVTTGMAEAARKHWDWTMDINAWAPVRIVQRSLPMMPSETGRIVAVSSPGAGRAWPGYGLVGASKAAMEAVVRHFANELGADGITANTVVPGIVKSRALSYFGDVDDIEASQAGRTPRGRIVTPEDVGSVVAFLCSDLAGMITGQTIVVDGGYSISETFV